VAAIAETQTEPELPWRSMGRRALGVVVFTKLKAELTTLAQPVPVPDPAIVGTTAGREAVANLLAVARRA
jgi:hypothetical protein